MVQPPGFVNKDKPQHICKLHKALYGLKQASRAWYVELSSFLTQYGFTNSTSDASFFIFKRDYVVIYFLVYVDNLIVIGNKEVTVT